jgi:hypothetical protein
MPCVYDNKFVIIEQEKIVLQKDSLEAGLDLLKPWSIPPRATKIQIMPCVVRGIFFWAGRMVPGGGSSYLGGNLRFGRNEVSVDDLFLNELD